MGETGQKSQKSAPFSGFQLGKILGQIFPNGGGLKFFCIFLFFCLTCLFVYAIIHTSKNKKGVKNDN